MANDGMVVGGEMMGILISPPDGKNSCVISANKRSNAFDAIRTKITALASGAAVNFENGTVYGYGSLSKNGVGLFSGGTVGSIGSKNFDVSHVTDMSYLFKDSSFSYTSPLSSWDVSKVTNMEGMVRGVHWY